MKKNIFLFLLIVSLATHGQLPDYTYNSNIHSIKLTRAGDIYGYPVIKLNSTEHLDLTFDDLEASYKNYYYTYQLCNADWSIADLHPFDYIKGFQNVRITTYRNSSIAFTRYINYQAKIPEKNSVPSKSGNYLLKVFLDGDTSKLVFTKRFLVVDTKASVGAQVLQPVSGNIFKSHQKLKVGVNINQQVNVFNQQDVKVVLLQNFAWVSAQYLARPNIYRGNYFEYYDESNTTFAAGKEWRWIDLRSLKLMSERMQRMDKQPTRTDVYVKPDGDRKNQVYLYYRDINGFYTIENSDNQNPYWQSDYGYVHFSFYPPGNIAYPEKDVFIYGELSNYTLNNDSKLVFNEEKGAYEKTLLLKQGFYNYSYVTLPVKKGNENFSYENTEGNYWGTENSYQVLVYYRAFGGRSDELIAYTSINSLFQRP
jgi:hypothetical protein